MNDERDPRRTVIKTPKESAAGIPAVVVSARDAVRKVGPIKGLGLLLKLNQVGGFDCPGCAWPDPTPRKLFEFCENGAKAVADEATKKRVTRAFFERWSVSELAKKSGRWLNGQGRLTEPMVKQPNSDHYEPISWDKAFSLIANHLNTLESPDHAAFYTSGRTSNEAAFLYQLFVRRYGTNNLPDCSNMCHESSGTAMNETIGSGKGTVTLEDFQLADAIFVVGQNPGSNHPRMLATLQAAKRNGATIVSVNPLDETGLKRFRNPQEVSGVVGRGTPLADFKLRIGVNGDVAVFKGIIKHMLEEDARGRDVLDHDFIAQYTSGFKEFRRDIEATPWDEILEASGVTREDIDKAAEIAMTAERTLCCWAMGITQHKNAVANIQEIVNFLLLRGNLGKPGAGACPVRGHSNVQGDRTMGIWEKPTPAFLDALADEFGFDPPTEHGYDTVDTIRAMAAGRIKVFFAMGGNFAAATPDTHYTADAIRDCELTVQVSTKLNRSHAITGNTALILPALGRTERDLQPAGRQFVTVENSMGVIQRSEGSLKPAAEQLKSEVRIVGELAQATFGEDDSVDWPGLADDYDRIRDHISRVVPGFDNFNTRIRENGSFVLPHPVRDERKFNTATGRALFTVHPIDKPDLGDDRYLMTTIRSHDQFNTTVYSLNDRYRGISNGRRVLFMNKRDITAGGLNDGDIVDITSHFNGEQRTATGFRIVAYDIPAGCVASYYPETNELVAVDSVADGSNTPAYKSVEVSVSRSR
ncbi:MAG: FdhF/YdeP family oxidoreductase [Gammaproteobacteria bacterium]